jgi:hypothetical protein
MFKTKQVDNKRTKYSISPHTRSNAYINSPLMMFQELQTLNKPNWVLLGSNANTHRSLMMLQELQTLDRLNWVFLGSNANTYRLLIML